MRYTNDAGSNARPEKSASSVFATKETFYASMYERITD
jgi:hypothetical protein